MIADSQALLDQAGLDDIVGGWANQHKSIETPRPGVRHARRARPLQQDHGQPIRRRRARLQRRGPDHATGAQARLAGSVDDGEPNAIAGRFPRRRASHIDKLKREAGATCSARPGNCPSPDLSDADYARSARSISQAATSMRARSERRGPRRRPSQRRAVGGATPAAPTPGKRHARRH